MTGVMEGFSSYASELDRSSEEDITAMGDSDAHTLAEGAGWEMNTG